MEEFLRRDALLDDIAAAAEHGGMGAIIAQTLMRYVKRQPSADVAPVVHGHWIPISDGAWAECNECGEGYDVSDNGAMTVFKLFCDFYKYCPNCGAKMDGGDPDGR